MTAKNLENGTSSFFVYDATHWLTGIEQRPANGTITNLTYDGWNLIEESDAAGALQQVYVHGAAVDELLTKINTTGAVYYHADGLGSTVALTNETGAVVESATYDAFGAATIRNASGLSFQVSGFQNRFLFTGRELISEAGIYDYRNRVYSPTLGRFLQTDPIRFAAGDGNIYRYCGNNPFTYSAPFGLCPADPKGKKPEKPKDPNKPPKDPPWWKVEAGLDQPPGAPPGQMAGWSVKASVGGTF